MEVDGFFGSCKWNFDVWNDECCVDGDYVVFD